MKRRRVIFSEPTYDDFINIYLRIEEFAGSGVAEAYVKRLQAHCLRFEIASERGHRRDDLSPGLRVTGFERRVTILFTVTDEEVVILRAFYGGVDWEPLLA